VTGDINKKGIVEIPLKIPFFINLDEEKHMWHIITGYYKPGIFIGIGRANH